MKIVGKVLGVVLIFIAIALAIGHFSGKGDKWQLCVVNGGGSAAALSITGTQQQWTFQPSEVKTLEFDGVDKKTESFTLQREGQEEIFEVKTQGSTVLDVTGQSCFVVADYGTQYLSKEEVEKAGMDSIKVITTISGKRLFHEFDVNDLPGQENAWFVDTYPGQSLPEQIKIQAGSTPKHIRMATVPCDLTSDKAQLFGYLNSN